MNAESMLQTRIIVSCKGYDIGASYFVLKEAEQCILLEKRKFTEEWKKLYSDYKADGIH